MSLNYVNPNNVINSIRTDLLSALIQAQRAAVSVVFKTAGDLVREACTRSHFSPSVAAPLDAEPLFPFADLSHKSLVSRLTSLPAAAGLSASGIALLADQTQLVRAFAAPDQVIERVRGTVERIVDNFPRKAAQLECGKNPGDVMDPFLLGATQFLLCGGSIDHSIEASVVHRSMMMLEDLVGNLHQDVLGSMRGNVRVPEPKGESWNLSDNPFPGADLAQPPLPDGEPLRFFQVKNKTGSAKGGDGKRLGDQFNILIEKYRGEVYYVAILGKTLQGHRSMGGVLQACPQAIVSVGQTAISQLTRSRVGGELLLRVYQSAFRDVARAKGYTVREVATAIALEFRQKLSGSDDDILDGILDDVTKGSISQQDSRHYPRRSK